MQFKEKTTQKELNEVSEVVLTIKLHNGDKVTTYYAPAAGIELLRELDEDIWEAGDQAICGM